MKKQDFIPSILFLLISQAFFAACIPMSNQQINTNAVSIYKEMVNAGSAKSSSNEELSQQVKNKNLAENQTIRLSGRDIYSYDPALVYSNDLIIAEQLFVGLTRMDPETKEFLPALAESWSVSEDQLTWTFNLQKNIPWVAYNSQSQKVEELKDENGKTRFVTAEDVKTGMLRVISPSINSGNAFNLNWIVGADNYSTSGGDANGVGIDVVNENTLAIHLEKQQVSLDALAELTLFSAYPSWLNTDVNQVMTPDMMVAFYGPYAIKEYIPDQSIVLIKNPLWKGTKGLPSPTLEEISFNLKPYGDQNVVASFKAGDLDAVELTYDEFLAVKDDPELKDLLHIESGPCGYYLLFNNTNQAPLDEAKIRQSISSSIDRQKLNDLLYQGTGSQLLQYIPQFLRGSQNTNGKIGFSYDPQKAKTLLDESNWIKTANLQSQTLQMFSIDSGNYLVLLDNIPADIQKTLGINVNVDKHNWSDYSSSIQNFTSPSLYLYGYCLDYADAQNLWDLWLSGSPFSDVTRGVFKDQDFFNLLNEASSQANPTERQKLYAQVEDILINKDTEIVPLIWSSRIWLIKPNINARILPFYQQLENWQILK